MLKRFLFNNYKNFKDDIIVDFGNVSGYKFNNDCITDGLISKMLIYGRNATGKTNLGSALLDIRSILYETGMPSDGYFLNADSSRSIAYFYYEFLFGDHEAIYNYSKFSQDQLVFEELLIDGIMVFRCDYANLENCVFDLHYVDAEDANTNRYIQSVSDEQKSNRCIGTRLPFLRWLISNTALLDDSILIELSSYVGRMSKVDASTRILDSSRSNQIIDEQELKNLETFINSMGVKCQLQLEDLPDGKKEIYFKHKNLVPFYKTASSGTLMLVDLYKRLFPRKESPSLLYLDEFDAFYHYEMADKLILFFKQNYPKSQIIFTSHNTNLMTNSLMRPDCLFILSRDGKLTPLVKATRRELREGHNLEKMYISGEFEKYE